MLGIRSSSHRAGSPPAFIPLPARLLVVRRGPTWMPRGSWNRSYPPYFNLASLLASPGLLTLMIDRVVPTLRHPVRLNLSPSLHSFLPLPRRSF